MQLRCELDALCLSTGQSCRSLTKSHVAQANFNQGVQVTGNTRDWSKELSGLGNRHIEDICNALTFVEDLQGLTVVACTMAHFAGHVNIRKKVHLNLEGSITLTGLAPSSLHIEGETPRTITAKFCLRDFSKELTDLIPDSRVGSRIRPRCTTDRRLVDVHDFVEAVSSYNRTMTSWNKTGAVQTAG